MNEAIIYASPSDWFGIGLRYTWQATLTRYEVNINHSQGKVLPSVRVSDLGLLLKPDEPNLIIMAKPAGGPSKRDQHAGMDED
ncbi:TCP-1/cpn60 chaperonin family protein [Prunus dulcis]|uniref:TCP-1/cpn60 chaperonin family protein n=1 Tax=Prunus dulcis TaxID=3755 RepID=A0A5H2XV19_PRUDU|nr:TCP-1/cpn60 chaperonin family protein [Prunus dulcis]